MFIALGILLELAYKVVKLLLALVGTFYAASLEIGAVALAYLLDARRYLHDKHRAANGDGDAAGNGSVEEALRSWKMGHSYAKAILAYMPQLIGLGMMCVYVEVH